MPALPSRWVRYVVPPLSFAAVPLLYFPLAELYTVSPMGHESVLWLGMFLILPLMCAVVLLPLALIAACSSRWRQLGLITALCCISYDVATVGAIRLGNGIRMSAFERLAVRSKPLIAAIKAYEQSMEDRRRRLTHSFPSF